MSEAVDNLVKKEIKKYKSEKFREELIKKYEDFDLGEFEPGDLTDTDEEKEKKLDKYLKLKHIDKDTLIAYYNYKDATKNTKEALKEKFYAKINKYIDDKINELESSEEENNDNDDMEKNEKEFDERQDLYELEIDGIKIIDLISILKGHPDKISGTLDEIENSNNLSEEEKKAIKREIENIKKVTESILEDNENKDSKKAENEDSEKEEKKESTGKKAWNFVKHVYKEYKDGEMLASDAQAAMFNLQYKAAKAETQEEKTKYLNAAEEIQMATMDKYGYPRFVSDIKTNLTVLYDKVPEAKDAMEDADLKMMAIKRDDKKGYKETKKIRRKRFWKNLFSSDYVKAIESYDRKKDERKEKAKELENKKSSQKKDSEDEETEVKDKDGVVWIKRKKERGEGYTYCRKDDRSVTMSQDEYKKRHQKESYYISLKNYLTEAFLRK